MPGETTSESRPFSAGFACRSTRERAARDIKEAVTMFKASYCLSYPTSTLC